MEFLVEGYMHTMSWKILSNCPLKKLNQFKLMPMVFYCFNLHFPIGAVEHLFMCLIIHLYILRELFLFFHNVLYCFIIDL